MREKNTVFAAANRSDHDTAVIVPVAGHSKTLYCSPNVHRCGSISNGVAFEFGNEGAWVIDLDTLRQVVEMAEAVRADMAKQVSADQHLIGSDA